MLLAIFAQSGVQIALPANIDTLDVEIDPTNASASVVFKRDGTIHTHLGYLADWISPKHSTVGDGYKVKFARSSGDTLSVSAAADNVYTADISADRTYALQTTAISSKFTDGTWTVADLAETRTGTAPGTFTAERST